MSDYFAALRPALLASALMAGTVLGLGALAGTMGWSSAVRLPLQIVTGAAAYFGSLWTFDRSRIDASLRFVRSARRT
jgi:hypothetical protein